MTSHLLLPLALVPILAGALACDDEMACRTNRVVVVVGEQNVPICDAVVSRISPGPTQELDTTATCKAVYEIEVSGDVEIEVSAPGRLTSRVRLTPAIATDEEPCRSQACAVVSLEVAP